MHNNAQQSYILYCQHLYKIYWQLSCWQYIQQLTQLHKQTNFNNQQFSNLINTTTCGYTNHEHLNETGTQAYPSIEIVAKTRIFALDCWVLDANSYSYSKRKTNNSNHKAEFAVDYLYLDKRAYMNGRIYAPHLGRFLQADPIIQSPFNTQSLNRYTYVGNNPLSANDPTGYASVDAFMQNIGNPIISIALAFIPYVGPYLSGAFNGLQAKAATGSRKKALVSAFVTVASSYAYSGIGDYYDTLGKLTASQVAAKIALHGLVGGTATFAQGGNFGNGFAIAGVTQSFAPMIDKVGRQGGISPLRVFLSAILGGTASRLTGGKFANGAVTGAFSRLFNDEKHTKSQRQQKADEWVQNRYGDILDLGNIDLEANMEIAKDLSISGFIENVRSGGDWDYKTSDALIGQFDPTLLDEFGNFHFGMVSGANGFTLNATVTGAGAYQAFLQSGGNKYNSILSILSSYATGQNTTRVRREIMSGFGFGDNPGDSFNIMLGWDYFHINQTDTFYR